MRSGRPREPSNRDGRFTWLDTDAAVDYLRNGLENMTRDFIPFPAAGATPPPTTAATAAPAPATARMNRPPVSASRTNPSNTTSRTTTVPPASLRVRRQLPTVRVRPEDLVDAVNRQCCCCLEHIVVHSIATRLPCAHLFHAHCIHDWLSRSCTCPICRYELPTDDAAYEHGRLLRMTQRRPRYARHELQRLTIAQLKALLQSKCLDTTQFLDKVELIDAVVASGAIDLIPTVPGVSFRLSELRAMRPSDLKRCMNETAGVFFDSRDVVEKKDMLELFIHSGRLEILPEEMESEFTTNGHGAPPPANRTEHGKPAATARGGYRPVSSVTVETVLEDDTEVEYQDSDTVFRSSPRRHTEWVLEEDVNFVPPPLPLHDPAPVDEATLESNRKLAAPNSIPTCASFNTNESANTDTVADMCDYFTNLSLPQLRETADRLNLDISDYVAQRERLDRTLAEKLAGAMTSSLQAQLPPIHDAGRASIPSVERPCSKRRRPCDPRYDNETNITDSGSSTCNDTVPDRPPADRRNATLSANNSNAVSDNSVNSLLETWSASDLRTLAAQMNVDLSLTLDRDAMVSLLQVAVSQRPSPWTEYVTALDCLVQLTIAQLYSEARALDLVVSHCVERGEILHAIASHQIKLTHT